MEQTCTSISAEVSELQQPKCAGLAVGENNSHILLVDTIDEAYQKIKEYEKETFSKFYVRSTRSKGFGCAELYSKKENSYIMWLDTLPYIYINQLLFDCKYGPDRHIPFKAELFKKREENRRKDHIQNTKPKKLVQCSRKLGCTATINLKEVFTFPEYSIPTNSKYNRTKASKELRGSLQKKEVLVSIKKFIVIFPANVSEHTMHPIGQVAEINHSIDERLKLKIEELVANSVTDTGEIKRSLQQYVTNQLFPETPGFPSKSNRRFYPSSKDIRSFAKRTLQKLSYSTDEQEKIQQMVDDHLLKYPDDIFFFRSYYETEDKITQTMLLVYQSVKQKYLLQRYGNSLCLLDAAYRTNKYILPLFFLCVKTNVNYQVVAIFITQDETTAGIIEALNILKKENPTWCPKHVMADFREQEINAIETVFPETLVLLCDIHREQAWEHWVKKSTNGVHQAERDAVLNHLQRVANAESVEAFDKAMNEVENCDFWKTNNKLQSWFKKEWLPNHKRWVWTFRKDKMDLPVNTNNGVEHRPLKYDHLFKKNQGSLNSMLNLIITKFIPDSFQNYEELNIKYSSGYRKYSAEIPEYLVNRPRPFILHCIERLSLAKTIQPSDIMLTSSSRLCLKIRSQTNKNIFYQVDFGNDDDMPSCECYDWQNKKWLCKHFFAVFQCTNLTWDDLSPKFKYSPYLNLDMSVKGVYERTQFKQNNTEITTDTANSNEVYGEEATTPTENEMYETGSNEITDDELVQQTISLAVAGAKVREMLAQIRTMSYGMNDPSVLEELSNLLNPVLQYISTKTAKEEIGFDITQDGRPNPTKKRKRNCS